MFHAKVFRRASKDKMFLMRQYTLELLFLATAATILLNLRKISEVQFTLIHLFVLLLAIPFGWVVSSFLHNTGHGNIKNKLLNRFIGEFCGDFVGYGHVNFILIHTLHHKFSDHKFDPVSPRGMTFIRFLLSPTRYMISYTKEYLMSMHGDKKNYSAILKTQTGIFYINLLLRQLIWFLLFGPTLYLCFYIPAVLSNITILAHINYVCHRDLEDGTVEIFNLNHNLFYKIANFVTIGGYYHKSHHLSLGRFDPRTFKSEKTAEADPSRDFRSNHRASIIVRYFNLDNVWGQVK